MKHELKAIKRMLGDWNTIRAHNYQDLINGKIDQQDFNETNLFVSQALNNLLGHKQAILCR